MMCKLAPIVFIYRRLRKQSQSMCLLNFQMSTCMPSSTRTIVCEGCFFRYSTFLSMIVVCLRCLDSQKLQQPNIWYLHDPPASAIDKSSNENTATLQSCQVGEIWRFAVLTETSGLLKTEESLKTYNIMFYTTSQRK